MGVTESNNSEKSESLSGGTSMSLVNEGHPGVALSPRSSSRYDDRVDKPRIIRLVNQVQFKGSREVHS